MGDLCRYLYKTVTVPKIKFSSRGNEEWNSLSDMRVTKNSSYPSFSAHKDKEKDRETRTIEVEEHKPS
jgi:hypothetical protein